MNITRHPKAFSTPLTETPFPGIYQLAHPFQLDMDGAIGLALNIRRLMAGGPDVEIGSDLVILRGLDAARPRQVVPLARSRVLSHPETGRPLLSLSYPVLPGFVPRGAVLADGSPHPHAGTGFGMSHVNAVPCSQDASSSIDGFVERLEEKGLRFVEMLQFSYDGRNFRIVSRDLVDFCDLIPGWRFVSMPLGGVLPDGEDGLLGGIVAAKADEPLDPGRAGLVRWKCMDGAWKPVEFIPVCPVASYEPSLVRDTDGALLMTARGCHENRAPGNAEALAESAHMNDIRVWRSIDNGASWNLVCNEKGRRVCTTVCMGMTAGGRPFVAGGPYRTRDRMGRELGKDAHSDWMREAIVAWPLSDDRTSVLDETIVREPVEELVTPPCGDTLWTDHPKTALLTLPDGKVHSIITYRVAGYLEVLGKTPPSPMTGSYIEEILD